MSSEHQPLESAAVPETVSDAAPAETAAAPEPLAAPAWDAQSSYGDLRSAYSQMAQENATFRQEMQKNQEAFAEYTKQRDSELGDLRQHLRKIYDPEGAKAAAQPQYVSREDLNKVQSQHEERFQKFQASQKQAMETDRHEREIQAIVHQGTAELRVAKEKFPELFQFGDAETLILEKWSRQKDKSLLDVAKEADAAMAKEFERRQAAYVQGKKISQVTNKPLPNGKTPPPSKISEGLRGFARLTQKMRA